ncbi:acyltransferase [Brasilonema sp. UFV-L1]|uniref:acyltransferase n=1 Tax=Brasilonema sp. UFV-L1 TaxID=2234130 RepID=UPI00145D3EC8|nr:acyltransferase [Brasilonema sp. UFV-L1]NMG11582.1 acyltransferase [Brasilonema sp. UFV-L1]
MNSKHIFSRWKRVAESLLTNLLVNIPTRAVGSNLRILLYRNIFAHIGRSVYIEDGVKFMNTWSIKIGDEVKVLQGVSINATGHSNNSVCLEDKVTLERGIDIRAMKDTCIHIGEGTFIGPYVCLTGPGNIKIGKLCLIAAHVGIFANNHVFDDPTQYIEDQGLTRQGIVIEDDCWLGHAVTVLDGVTIGKGSIIGAGAVVTKDIPPFSVALGVPAKVVKSRTDKQVVNSQYSQYSSDKHA